ncbi:hypothetical protein KC867_01155 [Candidatus Saccharibacteria bacterium]|nr:hypothetical protein [Candidatus Saccharibacteria bacterium]
MPSMTTKSKKTAKAKNNKTANSRRFKLPSVKISRRFMPVLFIAGFALIGVSVLRMSMAQTNTQSDCGQRLKNYNYKVPFGTSPWNVPACNLPLYNNSGEWAKEFGRRFYEYGSAWNAQSETWQAKIAEQKGKFVAQFGLAGDAKDYSTPIYYANKDTPRRQIMICSDSNCLPSNLDTHKCASNYNDIRCYTPDAGVPWEPSWRPSGSTDSNYLDDAGDREAIIVDTDTGYVYSVWRVNYPGNECLGRNVAYAIAGRNPENRLCMGRATLLRNPDGTPADYYEYSSGTTHERGMGIQNAAMIVTPEEVEAGEIRHALTMEVFNTMFGPTCSAEELKNITLDTMCGYAIAPATTVEWANTTDVLRAGRCSALKKLYADFNTKQTYYDYMTQDKMLPEGIRLVLNTTDAQIDQWIASRPDLNPNHPSYDKKVSVELTRQKARTAKIFATALKDYGWIVGGTTCYGGGFIVAGVANKEAKQQWAKLGIVDESSQMLLDGLFTSDNILALDPPTNTCLDGTQTKLACRFTESKYLGFNVNNPNAIVPLESSPITSASDSDKDEQQILENIDSNNQIAEAVKPSAPSSTTTSSNSNDAKNPSPSKQSSSKISANSPSAVVLRKSPMKAVVRWDAKRWEFRQSAEILWTASTPKAAGASIAKYTVSRDGQVIYEGLATKHYDTDVKSGRSYTYQVFATDSKGNKSPVMTHKTSYKCTAFGLSCSFKSN